MRQAVDGGGRRRCGAGGVASGGRRQCGKWGQLMC